MGKTVFTDGDPSQGIVGTIVTAAFLNAIGQARPDGLDQDGSLPLAFAADTGVPNAYAIAPSPALTQYIVGMPMGFQAANANSGASTLDINGLGAKPLVHADNEALALDDILAGQMVVVIYDGANFRMVSPVPGVATEVWVNGTLAAYATQAWANGTFAALSQFAASLGSPGYMKLPGGFIIQWGHQAANGNGNGTVTYPVAFTSFSIPVGLVDSNTSSPLLWASSVGTISFSWTAISIGNAYDANVGFYWIAVGR